MYTPKGPVFFLIETAGGTVAVNLGGLEISLALLSIFLRVSVTGLSTLSLLGYGTVEATHAISTGSCNMMINPEIQGLTILPLQKKIKHSRHICSSTPIGHSKPNTPPLGNSSSIPAVPALRFGLSLLTLILQSSLSPCPVVWPFFSTHCPKVWAHGLNAQ